jgi:hypothetical protein
MKKMRGNVKMWKCENVEMFWSYAFDEAMACEIRALEA